MLSTTKISYSDRALNWGGPVDTLAGTNTQNRTPTINWGGSMNLPIHVSNHTDMAALNWGGSAHMITQPPITPPPLNWGGVSKSVLPVAAPPTTTSTPFNWGGIMSATLPSPPVNTPTIPQFNWGSVTTQKATPEAKVIPQCHNIITPSIECRPMKHLPPQYPYSRIFHRSNPTRFIRPRGYPKPSRIKPRVHLYQRPPFSFSMISPDVFRATRTNTVKRLTIHR